MDKWLKCNYCGSEIYAKTIDGNLENHVCKDRQITQLQEQVESLKDQLHQANVRAAAAIIEMAVYRSKLKDAYECLTVWKEYRDAVKGFCPGFSVAIEIAENKLRTLGEI